MNKIVIAIDQSYTRSGWAIGVDGEIMASGSIKGFDSKEKTKYRELIRKFLDRTIVKLHKEYKSPDIVVVIERIRPYNMNYIMPTGALYGAIIDTAYPIPVYSLGTSTWKSVVLGKARIKEGEYANEINPKKFPAILYVQDVLGIDCREYDKKGNVKLNKKGQTVYNDDLADACCMAKFYFTKGAKAKLKREY